MIRKHENSVSWKAGTLSVVVHLVLLAALLISFNWKAAHTVLNVTEVDLWDKLPAHIQPKPTEVKVEPPPVPTVKEEPKPEPPKPVVEEKPKPEEPKVDIELEKKKQALAEKEKILEAKKLEEKRKQETLEKIKQAAREEELQDKKDAQKQKEEKLKAQMRAEDMAENQNQSNAAKSAANASVIGEFTDKIKAKIRGNVNKTLCGDGSPELRFKIDLLPTGDLNGSPNITKSSGNAACDAAVERAIIASQPLPLPTDAGLRNEFRNLNLKFRPNDN